jgi:SAM-dependent methyltransferase
MEKTSKFFICQPVNCNAVDGNVDKAGGTSGGDQESQEKVVEVVRKVKWYQKFHIPSTRSVKEENTSLLLKEKNKIFHQLYAKYSTREASCLSLQDRQQYSSCFPSSSSLTSCDSVTSPTTPLLPASSMSSLTYGEIQDIYSLQTIFLVLSKNGLLPIAGKGRFYDLGSGTGRVIIAAYLLYPFRDYIGIEILPSLVNIANDVKEEMIDNSSRSWRREIISDYSELLMEDENAVDTHNENQTKTSSFSNIHFFLDSILDSSIYDFDHRKLDDDRRIIDSSIADHSSPSYVYLLNWSQHGDVVFVNSTCFDVLLMEEISLRCANLKTGSVIITLTRILNMSLAKSDLIHELRLDMSW